MSGNFSGPVVAALKDAIVKVFWTRKDMRALLIACEVPLDLITAQNWEQYKFLILDPIIDVLNASKTGLGPLQRVLSETLKFKDGDHLLGFHDGKRLKRDAERCLEHLRLLVDRDRAEGLARRQEESERLRKFALRAKEQTFDRKLAECRDRFLKLHASLDRQASGLGLEVLLYDLFALFELQPRGAFRNTGEQIDGAFIHDTTSFLLEAKWQKSPVELHDIRDLDGAVGGSLDNTLGLFLSINGFTNGALQGYRETTRPRIVGMDGGDLMVILEARMDFGALISRKRAIASERGQIFVPAARIMKGEC